MGTRRPAAWLLCAALAAAPAAAHHSNAEYDRGEVLELEGEVVEVIWRNPHVGLAVRVSESDGTSTVWRMEAADLVSTVRRGVPEGTFEVGQHVRFAGFPSRRREARLLVTNVLVPGGLEVLLTRAEPRWSERTIGGGDWVSAAPVASAGDSADLFRVWTLDSTTAPGFTEDPPLTPEARAGWEAWDTFDDPALECAELGMPRIMTRTGPHPIEFVARGADIVILGEYFDTERLVHMGQRAAPPGTQATPLGYSVGRWEDGALVVTTTHVSWPYFDIRGLEGVPQSEAVEIVERFRVGADGSELRYDIEITDPATFTETVVANDYARWLWRPDIRIEPYRCTLGGERG